MKTTVKQIAAGTFIALLLMVGNAKATETKGPGCEIAETTLHIEDWMTDATIWNTNSINIAGFVQEAEEPSMELESWMTNSEAWNANNSFVEEVETGMELEGWMINDETWNTENINNDSELTVEPWMINDSIWI